MSDLIRFFAEPFGQTWFFKAMLSGSIVAIVCSVVGCLVILRRMSFLGDALSHAMIAGVGAGYLFAKVVLGYQTHALGMLLGALIAAVLTVVLINFVSKASRIKEDAAIGIMYSFIFAAGLVLVTRFQDKIHIHVQHFLVGDVLAVSDADLEMVAYVAAGVLSVLILFFREFQISAFDPVMAKSLGFNVTAIDYVFTLCISLVVVSAINMVGVILVVGLLITPAATAYLLTDRLQRMMWLAAGFGVTSVVGGLYLCYHTNTSGGGAIMVFCSLQFFLVMALAPRYGLLAGWIRRRRAVPQELVEDILRSILKAKETIGREELAAFVRQPLHRVQRALRSMAGEGLIADRHGALSLTDTGREHALRVQRAHRLWEAYLQEVGMPVAELDRRAHELEHIYEEEAVDYLDHKLGHPLRDPHGQEIPADFVHIASGEPVMLSLLRTGQRAQVMRLKGAAKGLGLQEGEHIELGGRRAEPNLWIVRRADGAQMELEHELADGVMVLPLPASGSNQKDGTSSGRE